MYVTNLLKSFLTFLLKSKLVTCSYIMNHERPSYCLLPAKLYYYLEQK